MRLQDAGSLGTCFPYAQQAIGKVAPHWTRVNHVKVVKLGKLQTTALNSILFFFSVNKKS